jgi:hypothetical protein
MNDSAEVRGNSASPRPLVNLTLQLNGSSVFSISTCHFRLTRSSFENVVFQVEKAGFVQPRPATSY